MHFFLVLEGDGGIVVEGVVFALLAEQRVFDEETNQDVGFEDFFELDGVAVFSLLEECLGHVKSAVLVVAVEIHDLSDS